MRRVTDIQAFRSVATRNIPTFWPWPGVPKTGDPLHLYPGDDGDLKMGYPLSGPRFLDLKDGTVLDLVTLRMWVANPNLCPAPIAVGGIAQDLLWEDAINACMNLDYAGYTDWRLPNIMELVSLQYIMTTGQQVDYNFFTLWNWYYWSSTTYNGLTTAAWLAEFIEGAYLPAQKTSHVLALPVRGIPYLL